MVNTVGKGCSEVDLAYLAGFLDADGAIMAVIEKHKEKKYGFRIRVIVKITQKNSNVLEELSDNYGIGLVRKNQTTYDWLIRDQLAVKMILMSVQKYLKAKKNQVEIALKILENNGKISTSTDVIKQAMLADSLAKFNVRSQNRRINNAQMVQEYFSRND